MAELKNTGKFGTVNYDLSTLSEGHGLVVRNGSLITTPIYGASAVTFSGAKISDPAGAVQDIGAATETLVTFDTVDYDVGNYADLGTNNDRLVISESGYYNISGAVEFTAASGGYAYVSIWKNGTSGTRLARHNIEGADTTQDTVSVSVDAYLVAGDYISVGVNVEDATQDLIHAEWAPWLSVRRLDTETALRSSWSPILDYKPSTDTPDDEFDSTTLDAKWTAVTGSSGTVSLLETGEVQKYDLTTRPSWLLMQAGSAANQKVELRQDFTLGDGDSIIAAISLNSSSDGDMGIGSDELWCGLSLNDNDTGYDAGEYNALFLNVSTNIIRLLHWDGSTVFGSTSPFADKGISIPVGHLLYLRFARSGSTVYAFWSSDGSSWMPMGSESRSATATNVWLFKESVAAASEPVPIVAVDWIRQGTNSLDPWTHSGLLTVTSLPTWLQAVDADSPISHLRLDETSGTTAGDRTGNSNTGTYNGSPTLDVAGVIYDGNAAVSLDGTDDYIAWNTVVGDLEALTEFTFEGWFNLDDYTVSGAGFGRALLACNTTGGGNRWVIRVNETVNGTDEEGFIHFHDVASGSGFGVDGGSLLASGTWNHFALTYKDGLATLYVNGVAVGGYYHASNLDIASTDTISIGQEFDAGATSDHFKGDVDDFVCYNTALSAGRIRVHFQAGLGFWGL